MTDQNIPDVTDDDRKLAREWAEFIESDVTGLSSRRKRAAARVILNAIPAPTPPTLAEMSPEERAASEWMQADVAGLDGDWLIIDPFDDEVRVHVIGRKGNSRILPADFVTPRPDLPRMEWSGTENASPSLPDGWRLADHKENGRVIVTNPTPDCYGTVYFAFPRVDCLNGFDWKFCDPDALTFIDSPTDQEADQ